MSFDPIGYLGEHFPGLYLFPPLFYRWPIGLRFDLGGRATTPEEMGVVIERATRLYEASFGGQDLIVVSLDWMGEESTPVLFPNVAPLLAFAKSEGIGLLEPEGQIEVDHPEDPEAGPFSLTWVRQAARGFRYERVFEGIGNADHGRSPAISSRVYFISPESNVIFHMYDDRGLDVIAERRDAIYALYREFDGWLLDYDRERMGKTFASNSPMNADERR